MAPSVDPQAAGKAFQRRFANGGWRASDRGEAASGSRRFADRVGQMLLLIALERAGDRRIGDFERGGGFRRIAAPGHRHLEAARRPAADGRGDAVDRGRGDRVGRDCHRAGARVGGAGADRRCGGELPSARARSLGPAAGPGRGGAVRAARDDRGKLGPGRPRGRGASCPGPARRRRERRGEGFRATSSYRCSRRSLPSRWPFTVRATGNSPPSGRAGRWCSRGPLP